MSQIVTCPKQPLSRDLDVAIFISRPQTEIATDMTLMCFLSNDAANLLPPNNSRVRYYSTFESLQNDFPIGTETYFAGQAFFARAVRPERMAVGAVFTAAQPAGLLGFDYDLTALKAVTDGAFDVMVNNVLTSVTGLDFSATNDISDVAEVIQNTLGGSGIACVAKYDGLYISTDLTGDGQEISYAETPASGTDVSILLGLTKDQGAQVWKGYTPQGLVTEAALIQTASKCNSAPIYGWTLDKAYRDTQDQKDFADWAEAITPAYFSACTNNVTAYNAADSTNICYYAQSKSLTRTSVIYHDNEQVYPDVSYIAYALATNYTLPNSQFTMKFKQLDGIEVSVISETELTVLESRNCNCYVAIGNNSMTVRPGTQGANTWFTDTRVGLDNFREELQVEVFNVFLRNVKVPYTVAGQNMLISAAKKICERYTRNGVFAPRDVEDFTLESGVATLPATNIVPVPVAQATASERASRTAPPIRITAYESGAFHKVTINVDVYN